MKIQIKRIFYMTCCLIMFTPLYFYYSASDSCRFLNSISENKELNNKLKAEFEKFINKEVISSIIRNDIGEVIESDRFENNELNFHSLTDSMGHRNLEVFLKRNSNEVLTHIGIGYARGYILFEIDKIDPLNISLTSKSSIVCRVYND